MMVKEIRNFKVKEVVVEIYVNIILIVVLVINCNQKHLYQHLIVNKIIII